MINVYYPLEYLINSNSVKILQGSMAFLSTNTDESALIVGGGADGASNINSGQLLLGGVSTLCGKLTYDYNSGNLVIDNTWDNDNGGILLRTKTSSSPIIALTVHGDGELSILHNKGLHIGNKSANNTWRMVGDYSAYKIGQMLEDVYSYGLILNTGGYLSIESNGIKTKNSVQPFDFKEITSKNWTGISPNNVVKIQYNGEEYLIPAYLEPKP